MLVHNYEENSTGTDWFVGDIHGEYNKFSDALMRINFDFNNDRMFCVGDLVDRGPESLKCLTLLDEPWFFSVKGNHEQMMLDALLLSDDRERLFARQMWEGNGGSWYRDLPYEYKLMAKKYINKVNELPNAIKVGDIGVIHAECPLQDWDILAIDQGRYLREEAMWSRKRMSSQSNWKVRGIKAVVVGHTPVKEATVLGNHVYIDLGVCFGDEKDFTIYSYDDIVALIT